MHVSSRSCLQVAVRLTIVQLGGWPDIHASKHLLPGGLVPFNRALWSCPPSGPLSGCNTCTWRRTWLGSEISSRATSSRWALAMQEASGEQGGRPRSLIPAYMQLHHPISHDLFIAPIVSCLRRMLADPPAAAQAQVSGTFFQNFLPPSPAGSRDVFPSTAFLIFLTIHVVLT